MEYTRIELQRRARCLGLNLRVESAAFPGGPKGEAHLTHAEWVLTEGLGHGITYRLGSTRTQARAALVAFCKRTVAND